MSQNPQWRQAEEYAVDHYDLEHHVNQQGEGWYDAVDPFSREKYQIKSAKPERRFRLWEDQHRSLSASAAQLGAAYYIFMTDNRPLLKVKSTKVTEWINERGGWNDAGHEIRDGRQLKIPVQWVYEQVD